MSIKAIVLVTVIVVNLLNASATALVFLDPKVDEKEAKKHLGSSLVRHTGEKVLMYQGQEMNLPVRSVFALAQGSYEQWRSALRNMLSQKFGIASENEVRTHALNQAAAEEVLRQFPYGPLLGEGFVGFQALGIRVEHPAEYRIRTAQYNKLEAISGYSELEVRLTDGRHLFGKDCALIVLRRTDHSREWYRHFQLGIPLPFKHDVEEDLVTSTEIAIVESLKRDLGKGTVEYFLPHPSGGDTEYWHDFIGKILRTVETF